jgi:outer membrane protein OmpA-like peptidoglycan-associated protein
MLRLRREFGVAAGALALTALGCRFEASFKTGANAQPGTAEATPASTDPAAATGATGSTTTTPASSAPAAASTVTVSGNRLKLPGAIHFQPNTPMLLANSGSETVLAQLKAYLEQTPRVTLVRVEGHVDNSRAEEASTQLSGFRASAVKQWLVQQGVNPARVVAVGFGSGRPVASNATPDGRLQNERIDVRIAELDGKLYLSQDKLGGGTEFP